MLLGSGAAEYGKLWSIGICIDSPKLASQSRFGFRFAENWLRNSVTNFVKMILRHFGDGMNS